MRRVALISSAIAAIALPVLLLVCWLEPPEVIRIGAAYAAKTVCSNVFLAGREASARSGRGTPDGHHRLSPILNLIPHG